MDRRQFLLGASGLSVILANRAARADQSHRTLILVELKGGNDGLNTVIPYADPHYHQYRSGIGVARERVLQLDERVGLNGKLEPLMDSWKARDLAIVQGVGYPVPNRSHFRSIEIWDTASASNQTLSEGWIARAFDGTTLPKGAGVDGIVADNNSLPMVGRTFRTIVMQDAENFLRQAAAMKDLKDPRDNANPALRHLLDVRHEVNAAAIGLSAKLKQGPMPAFAFGGPQMTSCQRGQTPGRTFVDKAKILDYCKGWDQAVAGVLHGYEILAMGVLGVFLGMFAWFASWTKESSRQRDRLRKRLRPRFSSRSLESPWRFI